MRTVIIYTTPACPWCHKVKDYLRKKNVPFKEVDVMADSAGAGEMIAKSGQSGVPVVDIEGNIIIGFDKGSIDRMLDLN